jgi:selenocysteine lyase/cysteine desulfurase
VDVESVRDKIPALSRCTYLNCGTFGPLPTPVCDEVVRLYRLIEAEGAFNPEAYDAVRDAYEDAREQMARLVGAPPSEIALTRNVSDGINIVATGFDWNSGDEVVISDQEHPSGALPWMNLAQRQGVVVRVLRLTADPEELLRRLEELLGPRTRLVFLSHVSSLSGLRIAAAQVTRLVHGKGIPIMLDGAHAVGQAPVDVKAIGCDFYAGCGHKWLLAPQGTGFLYVSGERLEELSLTWLGWGMTAEYDLPSLTFQPVDDAKRFEYATTDWALYGGLAAGISFAQNVGIDSIEARSQKLATELKRRLTDLPGIELLTPLDPDASAGLVAFRTAGLAHPDPGQWLWDQHRILVAHNAAQGWMRLSAAYFLLEEEVDLVVERLSSLAGGRARPAAAADKAETVGTGGMEL